MQLRDFVLVISGSLAAACGSKGDAGPSPGSGAGSSAGSSAPIRPGSGAGSAGSAAGSGSGLGAGSGSGSGSGNALRDPVAAAQCQRILDKAWTAIGPTLTEVGVEAASIEQRYRHDEVFLNRCVFIAADLRTCLEGSANPIAGLRTCEVNDGKFEADQHLWAPLITAAGRVQAPELDPADAARRLSALVGTWVNDWKSFGQVTTWKVSADGTVAVTRVRKDETEQATYTVRFERDGELRVQTTPSSSQTYAFWQKDARTFLASNNLAYNQDPVTDPRRFRVELHQEWLLVDGDTCRVISSRAEVSPATCTWSKGTLGKRLKVVFDAGRTMHDGRPLQDTRELELVGDRLVDLRMIDMGTFRKK